MSAELQRGDAFAGHRIDAVAGRGGMGVVYRATQLDLDRTVALKLIAPSFAEDPLFRERFIRETRVAAGIDHPNVIPVFYAGEQEGRLYLAMRFVAGEDLRTLIRREGPLTPARAARILAQVAWALDAAHASGIVHRDVKPANVLLDGGEHAYLTDFGLTKQVHGASVVTQPGGWVGTLGYVSPEQIRGERVDARADVYALGCVLFHALTGAPPHLRESHEGTLWAHLHEPPPALDPSLPAALNDVVARALAKDPADRQPSAGDLGRAMLAAAGVQAPAGPERTVATGAAAPPGGAPPVDEPTAASPGPPPTGASAPSGADRAPTTHVPGAAARPATRTRPSGAFPGAAARPATRTRPSGAFAGAADRPATRTRPSGAFAAVLLLSLSVLGGIVALALGALGGTDGDPPKQTTGRLLPVAPRVARYVESVPAGRSPNDVVVTRDVVWVSSSRDPTLTRIATADPSRPTALDVGLGVQALAAGYGTLWVAKGKTRSLRRLDLDSGRPLGAAYPLPDGLPVAVATGQGGVWVALRGTNRVVRLDPRTGSVDRSVVIANGIQDMAVGEDGVWVVLRRKRGIVRLDPEDPSRQRYVPVGTGPRGIAVGLGYVWVAISSTNTLQRIDPATFRKDGSFLTGASPRGVDVGGDSVWVTDNLGGSVTRILAAPGAPPRRVGQVARFTNPFAVAARGEDVWVTDTTRRTVAHLTTRP